MDDIAHRQNILDELEFEPRVDAADNSVGRGHPIACFHSLKAVRLL